ncbi:MAG: exodeoxyribonuclease III [Alphaproteobacteria bacterium]|nr:exodeoxyribonuclease III [Alphaproteobacteria bacterium]
MRLKLATWNINSVRLRADLVGRFLEEEAPDVLCLQETKTEDSLFPLAPFSERGYVHSAIAGQKGYHGVAILSRVPFEAGPRPKFCRRGEARHVAVALPGGIELHNFYVPAGGDVPDRALNEKFDHKLHFVDEMRGYFAGRKDRRKARIVLVGDLNIAPFEHDVWSHKQLLDVVSHTPVEVEAMARLRETLDFVDVARAERPEPEKLYTWWSYRARDWEASNRGRRLDHIWVSPPLKDFAGRLRILKAARNWERPSDHVPVTVELEAG